MECGKGNKGKEVGIQDLEDDLHAKNESRGRMGGIQKKRVTRDKCEVEEDETPNDGREEFGKSVELNSLDYL